MVAPPMCYAELVFSSLAVAETIASVIIVPTNGGIWSTELLVLVLKS